VKRRTRQALALGASIAVHGFALGVLGTWALRSGGAPVQQEEPNAVVGEVVVVDLVPVAAAPEERSPPEARLRGRSEVAGVGRSAAVRSATSEAPGVARSAAVPSVANEAPGVGRSAAVPAQASEPIESAESGLSPSRSGASEDAAGRPRRAAPDLSELHARLSSAASRCYPPAARRHRLTGSVEVFFCVDAGGQPSRIERRGSSGSELLDRAAESCVVQGAAPLRAPEGCYRVPVVFR
jgi:TonB family protein